MGLRKGALKLRCLIGHRWECILSRSIGAGVEHRTYQCVRCQKVSKRRVRL
jgi:hypothetical protein